MKHKVGDKVRIKSKEWYDANKKENGAVDESKSLYSFVEPMSKYLGMQAHITEIKGESYSIDLDRNRHYWYDWMFEDEQGKPTIFDRIKSAIIEAAKQQPLLVEQTEDGGAKISPIKVKEEEDDLPIDTPCMVTNVMNDWSLRYYAGNGETFIQGYKSKDNKAKMSWEYIIPCDKFNFENHEECLKYNIVK